MSRPVRRAPVPRSPTVTLPRVRFRPGEVVLAGAGPGGADHVTLRALAYLRQADVIVHDRLAGASTMRWASPFAERVCVGKVPGGGGVRQEEIHRILEERALRGQRVLRWKGGDPFVYGRGAEEVEHLRARGIRVTVVPGVSSVTGALTSAGVPIVHRDLASSFAVFPGEQGPRRSAPVALEALARSSDTLIGLMAVRRLEEVLAPILRVRGPGEPAALVQNGTTARERIVRAPLGELARAARRARIRAPAILVVGAVAAWTPPVDPGLVASSAETVSPIATGPPAWA